MQDVKHGNNSFRIRLTYTHDDASLKLNSLLPNDRGRKRKTGKHFNAQT
jgi:tRNA pseudouridine synthase 10